MSDRNVWVYQAKQAIDQFASRGIEFPEPVLDAIAVMHRVGAAKPTKPEHVAIRQAIIAGADQTELDRLLLAEVSYTRLASEWAQAHTDSAGAVLAAIRVAEPVLFPALRKQADAAIGKLATIAAMGDVRLEHLVRAGRQSDAALLAERDTIAADLKVLYEMRDAYLVRGGGKALTVNGVRCDVWKDPDAAAHARGKTPAERFVSGLAAKCQLWFPSPAEAVAAASAIADKRAAEAQRRRQSERGVSSVAAFW
jgi:hypothetical protein